MTEPQYARGTVVKGPDLLGPHEYRPYVCLSTDRPPFRDEEAVYAVVTTTRRAAAIPLAATDFTSGGLPRESYVNSWVLVTIKHAGIHDIEGKLVADTVEKIAREAATHLGVLDWVSNRPAEREELSCETCVYLARGSERQRFLTEPPAISTQTRSHAQSGYNTVERRSYSSYGVATAM